MFRSGLPYDIKIAVTDRMKEPVRHPEFVKQSFSGKSITLRSLLSLPVRFAAFIRRSHGRPMKLILMVLVFITALYTKAYTGDFQLVINNHIGGVFYVLFGSLAFSVLFPRMKMFFPVVMATACTCMLEFVQWFRFPFMAEITRIKAFAYIFGNSYNPADFVYYGMGSALALLVLWMIRGNE